MKAFSLSKKELILSLLRDHLVYSRLIQGLEKTGLDTFNFDLYLCETIFTLMGLDSSDKEEKLFKKFLKWSDKVQDITWSDDRESLDELSQKIYRKLKAEQKFHKHRKGLLL